MPSTGVVGGARTVVARTVEEVEALRDAWQAAPVDILDSDIDYFLTVVQHASYVVRPHVVLIQRSGRPDLMAIARLERVEVPLAVGYRALARPQVSAIVVTFGGIVGAGDPADEQLLIDELRKPLAESEADMLLLRKLNISSSLYRVASTGVGWLLRGHGQRVTKRWTADLPESLDAFLGARSKKTRSNLRRKDRGLESQYGEALQLRRYDCVEDLAELSRDLEVVAAKTYQRGLGAGHSGDSLDRALIEIGLRRGWFRTWMLYLSGTPVAFWSGTTYAHTFATWTPGFDPEHARESVGRYTMFRMIEDLCADERVLRLDFGHGEAEYKEAYGASTVEECDVLMVAPRPRTVALNLTSSGMSVINVLGGRLAKESSFGRWLKRTWRRRIAEKASTASEVPSPAKSTSPVQR